MKRILSAVVLLALLCVGTFFAVSAESEAGTLSAYLLKGELKEGETITVRFELNGLGGTSGAVMTENHFSFDPELLEFVSCKANHPDGWDFENEFAEDWSARDQKVDESDRVTLLDSFNLTLLDAKMEHPVKKDHVLFLDVELKLKKDVDTLSFGTENCYWASFEKNASGKEEFVRHQLQTKSITLSLEAPKSDSDGNGFSTGWIIAISVCAVVLVAGAVTVLTLKKKKS